MTHIQYSTLGGIGPKAGQDVYKGNPALVPGQVTVQVCIPSGAGGDYGQEIRGRDYISGDARLGHAARPGRKRAATPNHLGGPVRNRRTESARSDAGWRAPRRTGHGR